MRSTRVAVSWLGIVLAAVTTVSVAPGAVVASTGPGRVLGPAATVGGWDLDEATAAMAVFNGGDRSGPPPAAPFQVLTIPTADIGTVAVGGGIVFKGTATVTAPRGVAYWLPAFWVDDTPPVLGDGWPASLREGLPYVFGAQVYGADPGVITIDGRPFSLTRAYLTLTDVALPDGGQHVFTQSAFLSALPKGHHVVRLSYVMDGTALQQAYGVAFVDSELTFRITVT